MPYGVENNFECVNKLLTAAHIYLGLPYVTDVGVFGGRMVHKRDDIFFDEVYKEIAFCIGKLLKANGMLSTVF